MAPSQKNTFQEIKFKIKSKDYAKFIICYTSIREKIDIDETLPASLLKEFIGLMFRDEAISPKLHSIAKHLSIKAAKRLSSTPGYNFKIRVTIIPPFILDKNGGLIETPNFIIYDLERLFYEIILSYLKITEVKETSTKDFTLEFFLKQIGTYVGSFEKKKQKQFTKYRRVVMAGVLAQIVGFRLSKNKIRTNRDIFQAMRYSIRDIEITDYPSQFGLPYLIP